MAARKVFSIGNYQEAVNFASAGEASIGLALYWFHAGLDVERDPFQSRHLSSDNFSEDALQRSLFGQMIVQLVRHFTLFAHSTLYVSMISVTPL